MGREAGIPPPVQLGPRADVSPRRGDATRSGVERSDARLSYMYTGALLMGWIVAKKKKV
jgi:hypothetical protein